MKLEEQNLQQKIIEGGILMRLILIRHGKSTSNEINANDYNVITGQFDSPLATDAFFNVKYQHNFNQNRVIYTSELIRAQQTVEKLFPNETYNITSSLNERSLGVYEGLNVSECDNLTEFLKLKKSFFLKVEDGESYLDLFERVTHFLNHELRLSDDPNDEKVHILVTHLNVIKVILCIFNKLDQDTINQYYMDNLQCIEVEVM